MKGFLENVEAFIIFIKKALIIIASRWWLRLAAIPLIVVTVLGGALLSFKIVAENYTHDSQSGEYLLLASEARVERASDYVQLCLDSLKEKAEDSPMRCDQAGKIYLDVFAGVEGANIANTLAVADHEVMRIDLRHRLRILNMQKFELKMGRPDYVLRFLFSDLFIPLIFVLLGLLLVGFLYAMYKFDPRRGDE